MAAKIEIAPLTDRLTEDEVAELTKALTKAGIGKLPKGDATNSLTVARGLESAVLTEFIDRLETGDVAADIFLPIEFDGVIEAGDNRVASLQTLVDVLDEMKDDLGIDDDEDDEDADPAADDDDEDEEAVEASDEDDEDDDYRSSPSTLVEKQLRKVWKIFREGAEDALDRSLPLFVTGR